MKRKQGFLFDYNFCIGCKACEISCQVYHNQDPDINWRHVDGLMIHEDGIEKEMPGFKHFFTKPNIRFYPRMKRNEFIH